MNALILFVYAIVAVALCDDPHNLKAVHKQCQSDPELRLDQTVLDELFKNPETTNLPSNFNKHMLCLAKGLNLINNEGKINSEGLKVHIQHDVKNTARIEALMKECAVDQGTTTETINHLWKCLRKNDILRHANRNHHSDKSNSSESDKRKH